MNPGIKTTEFWIALAVTAAGAFAAVYATQPWAQALGVIAGALASAGYSFARGAVKAASITHNGEEYRR